MDTHINTSCYIDTTEMAPGILEQPAEYNTTDYGKSQPQLEQKPYALKNLQFAMDNAGRDFRSDVVTVPTEGMMEVS